MKTNFKSKKLVICVLAVLFSLSLSAAFAVSGITRGKSVSAESAYLSASPVTGDSVELSSLGITGADNADFKMAKGASMRINSATPGMRFTAYMGDAAALLQANEKYSLNNYNYSYYMEFKVTNPDSGVSDTKWVPMELDASKWDADNGGHPLTASLTFDNLSTENFEKAIGFDIEGRAILSLTKTASANEEYEDSIWFYAQANDNVRSMEAVVNAAIVHGEEAEYPELNKAGFVKSHAELTTVTPVEIGRDAITNDRTGAALSATALAKSNYAAINGEGGSVTFEGASSIEKIFIGAKKTSLTANGNIVTLTKEDLAGYNAGDEVYLSVKDSNGKFYNAPLIVTTKILKTQNDLNLFDLDINNVDFDGYFYLANDIVCDSSWTPNSQNRSSDKPDAFCGVLEGNGYTITYKVKDSGLFGNLKYATIKNVNLIVNGLTVKSDLSVATAIAACFGAGSLVENVLVRYDLTEPVMVKYYGWGQSSGLGLFESWGNFSATLKNVVVDMSGVTLSEEKATNGSKEITEPFAYGSLVCRTGATGMGDSAANVNGVYVVSPFKYLSYQMSNDMSALSQAVFASNDEAAYNESAARTKVLARNAYRFDTLEDLKAFLAEEGNAAHKQLLARFTDLTLGVPVAAGDKANFIADNAEIKVNGESGTEINYNCGTLAELDVSFSLLGVSYDEVSFEKVSGADLVNLESHAILQAAGTETIKATVNVEGTQFSFNVTLTATAETVNAVVKYSTMDNSAVLPEFDGVSIEKLTLTDGTVIYDGMNYYSEYIKQHGYGASADNTQSSDYTITVYAYLSNGAIKQITLISYTKVFTKLSDFEIFTTDRSEVNQRYGYYVLANDIIYSEGDYLEAFGTSASRSEFNGCTSTWFRGVFDGEGHRIEIALGRHGIFGNTNGAAIKNVSLIIKALNGNRLATNPGYGSATVFAFNMSATSLTDVYVKYDCAETVDVSMLNWGAGSGLGLGRKVYGNTAIKNVVTDLSSLTITGYGENAWSFGLIYSVTDSTANWVLNNVFFISPVVKELGSDRAYTGPATLGDLNSVLFAVEDAGATPIASVADSSKVTHLDGAKDSDAHRFDTAEGLKAYFDANAAKLALFTASVWDTSTGLPLPKNA